MVTIATVSEPDHEPRIALSPDTAKRFVGLGCEVRIESGAGLRSRFSDAAYEAVGAKVVGSRQDALSDSDILVQVRRPAKSDVEQLKSDAFVIGMLDPFDDLDGLADYADSGRALFSMEFIPRITRAQSMDVLSSQANLAGYKAVVDAASMFELAMPMMMTAAGTVPAARAFIMGVGVAGLQAIATAKRLGAVVSATDVRPATKEQVESLGAKFVDTGVSAEGEGGYARELTEEERAAQQAALDDFITKADLVVTTAAVPGKPAPRLISAAVVERMQPGAVIVDLGAESGGNCELTKPGETVAHGSVTIIGPLNVPSSVARHASEMYARNLYNLLQPALVEGELKIDWEDEVFAGSALVHDGEIKHAPTREMLSGDAS